MSVEVIDPAIVAEAKRRDDEVARLVAKVKAARAGGEDVEDAADAELASIISPEVLAERNSNAGLTPDRLERTTRITVGLVKCLSHNMAAHGHDPQGDIVVLASVTSFLAAVEAKFIPGFTKAVAAAIKDGIPASAIAGLR